MERSSCQGIFQGHCKAGRWQGREALARCLAPGTSAQCYGRGVWAEWIRVYVWLSPFAVHLKLSQHC